jgi:hypothetical protein
MPARIPLSEILGKQFGTLLVLAEAPARGKYRYFLCRCEGCGDTKEVRSDGLRRHTISVGCTSCARTSHGLKSHPLYDVWKQIVYRITNPNNPSWGRYGGRGIGIDPRWLGDNGITNFVADIEANLGPRPAGDYSLDRKDNNGDYVITNLRWADRTTQNRNASSNVYLEHEGTKLLLCEWAEVTGVPRNTIRDRLRLGWTLEQTLFTPVGRRRNYLDKLFSLALTGDAAAVRYFSRC